MATTVQQPRRAPRQPPPPSPPLQTPPPAPSTQAALPAVARLSQQLPCKRSRVGSGAAVERVADSCCPTELAVINVDGDDSGGEDGCASYCVGGGERQQDVGDAEVSGSVAVWWRQESSSSRRCFASAGDGMTTERECGGDDDDPTVIAARRREEDRKFWEACLASGYP